MTFREFLMSLIMLALTIVFLVADAKEKQRITDLESQNSDFISMLSLDTKTLARHYAATYDSLRIYQTSLTNCYASKN